MGDAEPSGHGLEGIAPGARVSVRRQFADGFHDVVGFVVAVDADSLTVVDRRGSQHLIARADIVAGHPVPISRGRDPLRTPLTELDALAQRAGLLGRILVIRISDLLRDRPPPEAVDEEVDGDLDGEWVSCGGSDVVGLAWWAARRGARSMQVRTQDASLVERLLALGFVERRPES